MDFSKPAAHDFRAAIGSLTAQARALTPDERLGDIEEQRAAISGRIKSAGVLFAHGRTGPKAYGYDIGWLNARKGFRRSTSSILRTIETLTNRRDFSGASRHYQLHGAIKSAKLINAKAQPDRRARWKALAVVRASRLFAACYLKAHRGEAGGVREYERNKALTQTFVEALSTEYGAGFRERMQHYIDATHETRRIVTTRHGAFVVHDGKRNLARRASKREEDIFGNAIIPGENVVSLYGSIDGKPRKFDIALCSIRMLKMRGWKDADAYFESKVAALHAKDAERAREKQARIERRIIAPERTGKFACIDFQSWGLQVVLLNGMTCLRRAARMDHECVVDGPNTIKKGEPYMQFAVKLLGDPNGYTVAMNLSMRRVVEALTVGLEKPSLKCLWDKVKEIEIAHLEKNEKRRKHTLSERRRISYVIRKKEVIKKRAKTLKRLQ